jgi:hypothetical protein
MFKENPNMYSQDISPDFDSTKQPLLIKSNAGSVEEIFQLIKSQKMHIFGTDSVDFTSDGDKNLTANIVLNNYQVLSVSIDIQNCD